jgi:hypothetical protein
VSKNTRGAVGRSEILLLVVTGVFQVVALFTLLRVATGIAAANQTGPPSSGLVIPSSLNQSVPVPNTTPQFVNPVGGGLSASLILAALFIGANLVVITILAFLYKKKKMKLFSISISVFLIFNVTLLYFSFVTGLSSVFPLLFAVIASIATIAAALAGSKNTVNLLAFLVALELGCSFPILLQTPLNYIVPAVYAVFDLYAIYYGRMGRLVKEVAEGPSPQQQPLTNVPTIPKSRLRNWPEFGLLTVNFPQVEIGMADIAFYTMVPAVALILVSVLAFFVVMAVVDLGLVMSFFVFRKKEVAPGLPIPILLGLAALLVMHFL